MKIFQALNVATGLIPVFLGNYIKLYLDKNFIILFGLKGMAGND